jgi:hypothetical protein
VTVKIVMTPPFLILLGLFSVLIFLFLLNDFLEGRWKPYVGLTLLAGLASLVIVALFVLKWGMVVFLPAALVVGWIAAPIAHRAAVAILRALRE